MEKKLEVTSLSLSPSLSHFAFTTSSTTQIQAKTVRKKHRERDVELNFPSWTRCAKSLEWSKFRLDYRKFLNLETVHRAFAAAKFLVRSGREALLVFSCQVVWSVP